MSGLYHLAVFEAVEQARYELGTLLVRQPECLVEYGFDRHGTKCTASLCSHKTALGAQRLVLDPVRLVGVGAQAALAVGLVVREVALEPLDVALALEREDVRRDAVEEPAI